MLKTFFLTATLLLSQDKPEGTSLLGTPLRSEKDGDGKIAAADAELAKNPKKIEALLKTGQARDAYLQYSASIPIYTKAIAAFPDDPAALSLAWPSLHFAPEV